MRVFTLAEIEQVVEDIRTKQGLQTGLNGKAHETKRPGRAKAGDVAAVPAPGRWELQDLDVVALFSEQGCYGGPKDAGRGMHAVECPWEAEHSTGKGGTDSDTIVFDGADGRKPGFECKHDSCAQRNSLHAVCDLWEAAALRHGATPRQASLVSFSDNANADVFVTRHGENLRFCSELRGWFVHDRGHWVLDVNGSETITRATETVAHLRSLAPNIADEDLRKKYLTHCTTSHNAGKLEALVRLAAHKPGVRLTADQFDSDPWALNFLNGTVDLRTGELRPHRREDYLTRLIPLTYDHRAQCPEIDKFLASMFPRAPELVEYLWDWVAYAATGSVHEQKAPWGFGDGSNGKGVFQCLLLLAFADYACTAPATLLLEAKGERHPTEVAALRGKRLVVMSEVSENRHLAEALFKRLTGGDRLSARFMRGDFFEFTPTHKLFLFTNHRPIIRGGDHAIWRRLDMIPFTEKFFRLDEERPPGAPVADPHLLATKLAPELVGFWAKAVARAPRVLTEGLQAPESVRLAVGDYRAEMDTTKQFMDEWLVRDPACRTSSTQLYARYKEWCASLGEFCHGGRRLKAALEERGLVRDPGGQRWWRGVRLLTELEHDTAATQLD